MTRGTLPEAAPAEGALKRRFSRRMALASVSMAAAEGGDLRRWALSAPAPSACCRAFLQ